MENIFDTNYLYPGYDDSLKPYFKDYFDSVFISFSPFFKIDGGNYSSIRQAKIISLEELQEKNEAFKNLKPSDKRVIYTNENTDYPEIDVIINQATVVKWQYILEHAGFHDYKEISLALRTSIGGLRREFQRKDLQKKLDDFATKNNIYHPTKGV